MSSIIHLPLVLTKYHVRFEISSLQNELSEDLWFRNFLTWTSSGLDSNWFNRMFVELSLSFSSNFRRTPRYIRFILTTLERCLNLGRVCLGAAALNVVNIYFIYSLQLLVWDRFTLLTWETVNTINFSFWWLITVLPHW